MFTRTRFHASFSRVVRPIGVLTLFVLCALSLKAQTSAPAESSTSQESTIEQIKKSVVFLQGSYASTQTRIVNGIQQQVTGPKTLTGTGFLIFIPDPRLGANGGNVFLVTNKHMIREPGPSGVLGEGPYFPNITMRINRKQATPDGSQFAILSLSVVDGAGNLNWFIDGDETVDLAVTPIRLDPMALDFKTIQEDLFASSELLFKEKVDENDEILFAGLFAWNPGAKKNFPIVRHGKIARLFEERIPLDRNHPDKTVAVHLAEVMSFGENSGSPVFLRPSPLREETRNLNLEYKYYLLGVMQGFFPEGIDFAIEVAEFKGTAAQNSGLAAVIPSDKILAVLDGPRGRAFRDLTAANYWVEKGDFIGAEKLCVDSIERLEKSSPQHGDLAAALQVYAALLRKTGRVKEAVALESRANRIRATVETNRMHPKT